MKLTPKQVDLLREAMTYWMDAYSASESPSIRKDMTQMRRLYGKVVDHKLQMKEKKRAK